MSPEKQKEKQPICALVVTHGNLARELVRAAKKIVGHSKRLRAVCIAWDEDVSRSREAIAAAIEKEAPEGGVLIMTDMFGGTPTNLSLSFLEPGRVEVLTGVNLPMLIKFLNLNEESGTLEFVALRVTGKGQQSIQVASGILDPSTAMGKDR